MDTKKDNWVFKTTDVNIDEISIDNIFILEKKEESKKIENNQKREGDLYSIRHYASGGYMNIIDSNGADLRGHGNQSYKKVKSDKNRKEDSKSTTFRLTFHSPEELDEDDKRIESLQNEEELSESLLIEKIKEFKNPKNEKRVISFGLYGSNSKYTLGAIRNAELRDTYFPGWEVWYYHDNTVPQNVIEKLNSFSNVRTIDCGKNNGISGMFWRFKVADDEEVDRYIVRDADSRLNSRERMAVEEWIESGYPIHLVRDHVNHCHPFNGGMWGGTKGAFQDIGGLTSGMNTKLKGSRYMGDMNFLNEQVYPKIKAKALSHDAYCCGKFENSKPFPTKRPANYQHVGQVFSAKDEPRMSDIDGFIRGKEVPAKCRRKEAWIYG